MIITLKEGLIVPYRFKFLKKSRYKEKKLSDVHSRGEFLLSMKYADQLELEFKNRSYFTSTTNDPLIFSPVKLNYTSESNVFLIKNKAHLKVQWDKYKEKYRNAQSQTMIFVIERLYFHILLGLEYDLLSSGPYIPFFVNIYNQEIDQDKVLNGMSWVANPLAIPLRISYECSSGQADKMVSFTGVVSLDEENLARSIADKNFQKQAKSYHYTRNFTITSNIKNTYDLETGYLISAIFQMKLEGKEEGVEEEFSFEVFQSENEQIANAPGYVSFLV